MRLPARFRSWFEGAFLRSRVEREMSAELAFHIEQHAEELVRRGLSPAEAARQARLEFGGIDQTKEACRDARGADLLQSWLRDAGNGLRILCRNPAFAALAILTLAVGIGATTAVFSLVNTVLLRSLPYADPGRLVFLYTPISRIQGVPMEAWGPVNADFYDWQEQAHSFESLALFTTGRMNLSGSGTAVTVGGAAVTGSFFRVLGVAPELGRAVGPGDDHPGKAVAVISHALWQSQFGLDRGILRKEVLVDAQPYRIIGVMPAGFAFPHGTGNIETVGQTTDVWLPWGMTEREKAARDDNPGNAIGRLRQGVAPSQAQAELSAIHARLDRLHPPIFRGGEVVVRTFDVTISGSARRALAILMGAVLLVLLIACTNVVSLILARASARAQEMSVRTALGASRLRLIRQILAESACLAGAGAFLGVWIGWLAVRAVVGVNPGNIPRLDETTMDWRVLLFTLFTAVSAALLAGLLPALSASGRNLAGALRGSGTRGFKGGLSILQRWLAILEIALTVVLLTGSGLLIRSFVKLQSIDKGYATASIAGMNIRLDNRYELPERRIDFYRRLLARANAIPGVDAAAAITFQPLGTGGSVSSLEIPGQPQLFFEARSITPRYFAVMGIPLLHGRAFTDTDVAGSAEVMIVSRSFVSRYFPGQDLVGKRFRAPSPNPNPAWTTIVGVVPDVRQSSLEAPPPVQMYTPMWQAGRASAYVVARTRLPADRLGFAMRAVVRDLDPAVAVGNVNTLNELISAATSGRRFQTLVLTIFGGVALFLSLVGLYGLMAYSVERRTGEIGIRMALGATSGNVIGTVVKEGVTLALYGIGLGGVFAWGAARFMRSFLFETTPNDLATYSGVMILFSAVALVACYVPGRRAARTDPTLLLRYE